MKRELGIARCGLACALCSQNETCAGCDSDGCSGSAWCENRRCSMEKGIRGCYECSEDCRKGLLGKAKSHGFTSFVKQYGSGELLDCLERNEGQGVVYHREEISGDYDGFEDEEALIQFIKKGSR